MSFRSSLFKNDRKQTDKQPDFTGPGSITKEDFLKMADAVTSGQCKFDDRGEIKMRVAGWRRESQGGKAYISLSLQLDDYEPQSKQAPVNAADPEPLF